MQNAKFKKVYSVRFLFFDWRYGFFVISCIIKIISDWQENYGWVHYLMASGNHAFAVWFYSMTSKKKREQSYSKIIIL